MGNPPPPIGPAPKSRKRARQEFFQARAHDDYLRSFAIVVSDHALRRLKKRTGGHYGEAEKIARRAWEADLTPRPWWQLRRQQKPRQIGPWGDRRSQGHVIAYRRYGNSVFVFDQDGELHGRRAAVLVTVLNFDDAGNPVKDV